MTLTPNAPRVPAQRSLIYCFDDIEYACDAEPNEHDSEKEKVNRHDSNFSHLGDTADKWTLGSLS